MTDASSGEERDTNTSPTLDESDPELYYEDDEDEDEENDEGSESDSDYSDIRSILSEDSIYPFYEPEPSDKDTGAELTLYCCCVKNDAKLLQEKLDSGVTREEVMELDINGRVFRRCSDTSVYIVITSCYFLPRKSNSGATGHLLLLQNRIFGGGSSMMLSQCKQKCLNIFQKPGSNQNGLMVACYKGFIDIVVILSKCPYVNVNHQDNDGNTALMIAAQAGFSAILNYLLNYYPGLEIEKRDARGLTALMKAAMQGKNDCVSALLLSGADLTAVDPLKRKTAREWAALTGRFETIVRIRTLLQRPCAEQFSNKYSPEWPALPELVAEALGRSSAECLSERIRAMFRFPRDPEPDGVMDHMVRMTTCLASPFVTTACRTICPDSPPEVGKQRLSVPEILNEYTPDPDAKSMAGESSCNSPLVTPNWVLVPYRPHGIITKFLSLPLHFHRNIIYPGGIPKIKVTKSPAQRSEKLEQPSAASQNTLKLPRWRYQELREARKKAEEAVKKAEEAARSPKKKGKRRKGKPKKTP